MRQPSICFSLRDIVPVFSVLWVSSRSPFRHLEEKVKELEELRADLHSQVDELEEENDHVKRQHMMANEVKNKLRQETSQLTAENMVRSGTLG